MKHPLRRFFTLRSVILCVLMSIIWTRSYWYVEVLQWDQKEHRILLASGNGWLIVSRATGILNRPVDFYSGRRGLESSATLTGDVWAMFWTATQAPASHNLYLVDATLADGCIVLTIHDSIFVLALALLPALALIARFRKRNPIAHCLKCGYDLRASPGRCPECGAEPAGAKA